MRTARRRRTNWDRPIEPEDAESDPAAEGDARPDADAPTATDPDSDRKTYAEDADAEIVPGADQSLTQQGDGGKTPEHDANGGATGAKDADHR